MSPNPTIDLIASTVTTHTPIQLAPGLELMVHVDHLDDDETSCLVDKIKTLLDRAEHARELTDNVNTLRERSTELSFRGLEMVLEGMGWDRCRSESTHDELADGIIALIPSLSLSDLIVADEISEYEVNRAPGSPNPWGLTDAEGGAQ